MPFNKKLKAATWVEAEPILRGTPEKTFPPTGGMSAEARRGMLAVAGHVAWAAALHGIGDFLFFLGGGGAVCSGQGTPHPLRPCCEALPCGRWGARGAGGRGRSALWTPRGRPVAPVFGGMSAPSDRSSRGHPCTSVLGVSLGPEAAMPSARAVALASTATHPPPAPPHRSLTTDAGLCPPSAALIPPYPQP